MGNLEKQNYSEEDIAYMQSLASAVVQKSPKYMVITVLIIVFVLGAFIAWLNWAEIDIVVRGSGKVVPSSQVQKVQSLEGGVVSEIFVKEGDLVEYNQPLLKISDIAFESSFGENEVKMIELKSKMSRLQAEAFGKKFVRNKSVDIANSKIQDSEEGLYRSNKKQLQESIKILKEQVAQKRGQLDEVITKVKQLEVNLSLIQEEMDIKKPLLKRHIISEVEFLKLKQQRADARHEIENNKLQIPRVESEIKEAKNKIVQSVLDFRNTAKEELNGVSAEVSRIEKLQKALTDRVQRTTLRSPVKGTVTRLYNNTVGGVVAPGADIVDVVPLDDLLIVEVKIKPADIANLLPGQKTRIKFSAYDFAIYGSLGGIVGFVSADTITDRDGETYYLVRIWPEKNYLGHKANKLRVLVGMTVDVDIIISKRTIFEYIMKPIYRGLDKSLGEE